MKRKINTLLALATILLLAISYQNCSSELKTDGSGSPSATNDTNDLGDDINEAGGADLTVSSALTIEGQDVTVNFERTIGLSDILNLTWTITSANLDPADALVETSGTVTLGAGQQSAEVVITTIDNALSDGDRIFDLNISEADDKISPLLINISLTDDEGPLTIIITGGEAVESNVIDFNIQLTNVHDESVTFDYATADLTANAGTDYTAATGNIIIPAGETEALVSVSTIDDGANVENLEEFVLSISNAVGAQVLQPDALGKVINFVPEFVVATSTTGAPIGRSNSNMVWTGTEAIVWGGVTASSATAIVTTNTGGRYNPALDSWLPTSTVNAPSARFDNAMVWTGTEVLVWGGRPNRDTQTNTGARYNPANDTWTPMSTMGAPSSRTLHTYVWTGTELIVWGGYRGNIFGVLNDGAKYNPVNDTWLPISSLGAPSARSRAKSVWTGTELIVWGGQSDILLRDGARYNPALDTWTSMSTTNSPSGFSPDSEAVWTGSKFIAFYPQSSNNIQTANGGIYDPLLNTWSPISTVDSPISNIDSATAHWSGTEMVYILGGGGNFNGIYNYNPISNTWRQVPEATVLGGGPASVWTGSEAIAWGGGGFSQIGFRYNLGTPR